VGGEVPIDKKGLDRSNRKIIEIMPKDFSVEHKSSWQKAGGAPKSPRLPGEIRVAM